MREIKYKAIVVKSKLDNLGPNMNFAGVSEYETMIDVRDISFQNGKIDYVTDNEGDEYYFSDNSIKAVIQYTRLKDKNGKEIYEGDIVRCKHTVFTSFNAVVRFGEYEQDGSGGEYSPVLCVGFYAEAINKLQKDEFGCRLVSDYMENASLLDFEEVEIIGNQFENLELLEVTE